MRHFRQFMLRWPLSDCRCRRDKSTEQTNVIAHVERSLGYTHRTTSSHVYGSLSYASFRINTIRHARKWQKYSSADDSSNADADNCCASIVEFAVENRTRQRAHTIRRVDTTVFLLIPFDGMKKVLVSFNSFYFSLKYCWFHIIIRNANCIHVCFSGAWDTWRMLCLYD